MARVRGGVLRGELTDEQSELIVKALNKMGSQQPILMATSKPYYEDIGITPLFSFIKRRNKHKNKGKTMNNVMIDLETMSTDSNAAIVSIGAVFFDEKEIGKTFYVNVDLGSSVMGGGVTDQDTIQWWNKQPQKVRNALEEMKQPVERALNFFTEFLGDTKNVKIWGNSSSFDNVILSNAYKRLGKDVPWQFCNDRCYRTVKNLFKDVEMKREGEHHNAKDDAASQAKHLIEIIKKHGIKL